MANMQRRFGVASGAAPPVCVNTSRTLLLITTSPLAFHPAHAQGQQFMHADAYTPSNRWLPGMRLLEGANLVHRQ